MPRFPDWELCGAQLSDEALELRKPPQRVELRVTLFRAAYEPLAEGGPLCVIRAVPGQPQVADSLLRQCLRLDLRAFSRDLLR
jgi:hypothetical protein